MSDREHPPRLALIAPAPVQVIGDTVRLDVKFAEGMRLHQTLWPGPITCILRAGGEIAFPVDLPRAALGFGLTVLEDGAPVTRDMLAGYDVVMLSGDDAANLGLPALARKAGAKTCQSLEYTLETRLRTAWLDPGKSLPRRVYSLIWNLRQEPQRRRALRRCDAVQANGYPAFEMSRRLNDNTLLYLDNRMEAALYATEAEMSARAERLASGAPLRLIYSGRLHPMKGAQDLVPLATALRARGLAFTLDIFGSGPLEPQIRAAIAQAGLDETVRLKGSVDFAAALVPFTRTEADLFVAPHREGDPSCTYIEAMGCGVPVAGYANEMWRELRVRSGAGWQVPIGRIEALATTIAEVDGNRAALTDKAEAARRFAMAHSFETEFANRMAHLRALVAGGAT